MELTLYQIDAFTDRLFCGNPAAVCPLHTWPQDSLLQAIAEENNLSETAFYVPVENGFHLRWFTPVAEVALCGHATLATAFVIFNCTGYTKDMVRFASKSGDLFVKKNKDALSMDFPSQPGKPCEAPHSLIQGLNKNPVEVLSSEDYIAVFNTEEEVLSLQPDFPALCRLNLRGVVATAQGRSVDFVSRFFAPRVGVNEDPVTGSAHCELTPYWADKLGKTRLLARQISKRGGDIACELNGNRVIITGKAVKYMTATISVDSL